MATNMRRGTPSAELFGDLLAMIRRAQTRASMRRVGDDIPAPAATVSQVEKGQRAVKFDKLEVWAGALNVETDELRELWWLSQGQVLVGDRRVFYTEDEARKQFSDVLLRPAVVRTLERRPELEPIYRLTQLIEQGLSRVITRAEIQVGPFDYEPLHDEKSAFDIPLTPEEEDERADHAKAFVPLPVIECYWDDRPGDPRPREINDRHLVLVPVLEEFTPIVRRRAKSMDLVGLEDLIRELTGPERERVRGYVDAVIQQRSDRDH